MDVGPLHVVLHVALLREADAAHLALEGLLASVLDHVDLQCALLVEGFVALSAFKGTFACKKQTNRKPELNLHSIPFPSGHYLLSITEGSCVVFFLFPTDTVVS